VEVKAGSKDKSQNEAEMAVVETVRRRPGPCLARKNACTDARSEGVRRPFRGGNERDTDGVFKQGTYGA